MPCPALLVIALAFSATTLAIPIDNGVIGYPEVTCGPHSIRLDVKTKNPFIGRIYVKGEADVPGCSTTTHPDIGYDVPVHPGHPPVPPVPHPAPHSSGEHHSGPYYPGYAPAPLLATGYEAAAAKKKSKTSKRSTGYPEPHTAEYVAPPHGGAEYSPPHGPEYVAPSYHGPETGGEYAGPYDGPEYGAGPHAGAEYGAGPHGEPVQHANGGALHDSSYGNGAFFELPLGHCNMRRARTLYPRGVEYTYVAVVSFHPLFITKVDKAYRIKCFYMEAEKAVHQNLEVAMITTAGLDQQHPMPVCQYHIKREGYEGNEIRYAKVGDKVIHIWKCTQEAHYQYGILIKNCYVDNGRGKKFQLVDSEGCSVDIHLLPQITYNDQYLQASVHSHVFKFADIPQLYFTCTVQLCIKTDGGCEGVTPPACGYKPLPHPQPYYQPQHGTDYETPHIPVPVPVPPPPPGYMGPPNVPHYQDLGHLARQAEHPHPDHRAQDYKLDDAIVVRDAPPEDILTENSTVRYLNANDVKARVRRAPTPLVGSGSKGDSRQDKGTRAEMGRGRGSVSNLEAEITSQPLLVLPYEDEILHDDDLKADRLTIVDGSSNLKDISGQMCLTTLGFNIIVAMFALLCALSMVLSGLYLRGYIRSGKRAL